MIIVSSELAPLAQNIKTTECNKSKCFDQHVIQNDRFCNEYTGFPTNIMLQAVFQYLDPGETGENFMLYNNQKANENETRGLKQMLTTM